MARLSGLAAYRAQQRARAVGAGLVGAQPPLFQVANLSEASLPHESAPNPKTDRTPFRLLRDVDGIAFAYQNDSVHFDGTIYGYEPFTVKPTLELADGTLIPVTFKGARSVTIQTGEEVVSDIIPRRLLKGRYWHRAYLSSNGTRWPCSQGIGTAGAGAASFWGDAADSHGASDFTVESLIFTPSAILGTPLGSAGSRVLLLGDSITAGFLESNHRVDAYGDLGGYGRGLSLAGIPHTKISVAGMRQTFPQTPSFLELIKRVAKTNRSTHLFTNLSIYSANYNLTEWKQQGMAMWDALAQVGLPIIQGTIGPWSNSTDNWATVENQTATALAPQIASYNAWMLAKPHSALMAVIDTNPAIEYSPGTSLWKPGTAFDALHPNETGHAALGLRVRDQILALGLS